MIRVSRGRAQAPAGQADRDAADVPEGLAGSLKGDVSVEAVPDLGILIIRGNQGDVESVMQVIKEIERLKCRRSAAN